MHTKLKHISVTAVFLLLLVGLGVTGLLLPDQTLSKSERRQLTQFNSYSDWSEHNTGLAKYFSSLETYLLDQFPARDAFRQVQAITKLNLLGQSDNNGYYLAGGHLAKQDAVMSNAAVTDALSRFEAIRQALFAESDRVYYAVVPDKNYFTAASSGHLHYDYDAFFAAVDKALAEFQKIDLLPVLTLDNYYRTDPHWSQQTLLPVADRLLDAMGAGQTDTSWQAQSLPNFYGTYFGQAALPAAPDTLRWLTSDALEQATVYNYETGKTGSVYTPENFTNVDPYDVFLSGAAALLKIENPAQENGKQLIVFRDSFGSSLVPLLIPAYSEILVVDIRYISQRVLGSFLDIQPDCDVLFLYSTSVLNSLGAFMK